VSFIKITTFEEISNLKRFSKPPLNRIAIVRLFGFVFSHFFLCSWKRWENILYSSCPTGRSWGYISIGKSNNCRNTHETH